MLTAASEKLTFQLYDRLWGLAMPLINRNRRLSEGIDQRLFYSCPPGPSEIWIQAASVGESFLVLEILKRLRPGAPVRILLTTNTTQGLGILEQARSKHFLQDRGIRVETAYFPFDRPRIMQRAVRHIQPALMVLLETELWPAHLAALKSAGTCILVVNGRMSAKSLKRYRWWPAFWRHLSPDGILAMSAADASRFAALFGPQRVAVIPNLKFDRLDMNSAGGDGINPLAPLFLPDVELLVMGSIREAEEEAIQNIITTIRGLRPDTVIGLFPRHVKRLAAWASWLDRRRITWRLRSRVAAPVAPGTVILWDTFGELVSAYRLCRAAFVGGSLAPLGGQNFLEAVTSGVVPVIGPHWDNFAWVGDAFFKLGLIQVAADWRQAADLLAAILSQTPHRENVRRRALQYIKERQGGTDRVCRLIESALTRPHGSRVSTTGCPNGFYSANREVPP
ncbi:MAG: 3-deoxy-D-manno-octulosonic acid transferase [Desulfobacterales bacterium]|nr:3-deoxy-D-manno-octulosonic acid transferase [Desulfobacterales bacterium]